MNLSLDLPSATALLKALSVSLQSSTLGLTRHDPASKQWASIFNEWNATAAALTELIDEMGSTLDEMEGWR